MNLIKIVHDAERQVREYGVGVNGHIPGLTTSSTSTTLGMPIASRLLVVSPFIRPSPAMGKNLPQ